MDRKPAPRDLGKVTGRVVQAMGWRSLNLHTHISLVNRYVYFEVPKAGCGTMKQTLGGLEASRSGERLVTLVQDNPHDRTRVTPFVKPFQLPSDELEHVLTSRKFTRFAVVREPAARLLSGWLEKITQGLQQSEPIFEILTEQGRAPERPGDISFADFIDVICALPSRKQDPHWRRQTDQIGLDFIRFNALIHLEDLETSWDRLGELTGSPGLKEDFFCKRPTHAGSHMAEHYTPALLDQVAQAYAADYKAFGYAVPRLG
ncbi:MAG: sulfotransferase family protein [Candidatus Nanopelagicales bacterium]|nr:sulfotransferase family protein [Candidatus Nanopelagicales bacterium]